VEEVRVPPPGQSLSRTTISSRLVFELGALSEEFYRYLIKKNGQYIIGRLLEVDLFGQLGRVPKSENRWRRSR